MMFRALLFSTALLSLVGCVEQDLYTPSAQNPITHDDGGSTPVVTDMGWSVDWSTATMCSKDMCSGAEADCACILIFSNDLMRWTTYRKEQDESKKWAIDGSLRSPTFTSSGNSTVAVLHVSQIRLNPSMLPKEACLEMQFTDRSDDAAAEPQIAVDRIAARANGGGDPAVMFTFERRKRDKTTPSTKDIKRYFERTDNIDMRVSFTSVANAKVSIQLTNLIVSAKSKEACK